MPRFSVHLASEYTSSSGTAELWARAAAACSLCPVKQTFPCSHRIIAVRRSLCFNLLLHCAASSVLLSVTPLPISAAGLLFSNNPAALVRSTFAACSKLQPHVRSFGSWHSRYHQRPKKERSLTGRVICQDRFAEPWRLLPDHGTPSHRLLFFELLSRIRRGSKSSYYQNLPSIYESKIRINQLA